MFAGSLGLAGPANATPYQDSQYVSCVAQDGLFNYSGPSAQAAEGRAIAYDISSGLRTEIQERNWVYHNTPANIGLTDANYLVNCATQVYLGYGPGLPGTTRQTGGDDV